MFDVKIVVSVEISYFFDKSYGEDQKPNKIFSHVIYHSNNLNKVWDAFLFFFFLAFHNLRA